MGAFNTSLVRSIKDSLGRFLAIAAIVALGCGFYGGLRMTGPDMRAAADRFFDGTHLYDIRLVSTLGYSDSQIAEVAGVEGVSAVMPAKSVDVMGSVNGEQYAMRVSTIPLGALNRSSCADGCNVESDDSNYLNRLTLEQGRWPITAGECVISADRVAGVPFKMGDTLEVLYGAQDLDGVLRLQTFTIVGTAHSSSFVSAVTMGATSLGNGSIQQFAYVASDCFVSDYPYTELFVEVEGARELFSGSSEYDDVVACVEERFNAMKPQLAESRLADLRTEAQDELDSARSDYEQEKADALAKLDDAQKELEDAEKKVQDARDEVDSGQAQIDSGYSELYSGYAELESKRTEAQTKLEEAYNELVSAEGELSNGWDQLETQRASVEAWPAQKEELESQLAQAQDGLSEAEAGLASLEEGIAQLEAQLELVPEDDPIVEALQAQIAELEAQKATLEGQISELPSQIAQIEAGIAAGDAGLAEFESAEAELLDAEAELEEGWEEYYTQKAEAEAQIAEAEQQLYSAQQELISSQNKIDSAREEISTGQADLESGKEEYASEEKKAYDEFDKAEAELADAQKDIDDLEAPDIYVLNRSKNYGVASQIADSERIDNIGRVFPFIFFLVAALVALTTMTRMVDEERVLIGTFKALGYSKARITGRYLIYAGVASVVGAVVGLALLSQVLPYVIAKAYAIIYNIPDFPLPLPFDWKLGLLSGGLGVGITLVATLGAAIATLRETPAALMLPRAPKAGKRILLEHIKPLWKRVSFSWKVTFRNLFRYKKRLFMTIVGIAGCTALLLTGWGLHNAIWDIIDKQFGPVVNYNVMVKMESDANEKSVLAVENYMKGHAGTERLTKVHTANMQIASQVHDTLGVEVVVPKSAEEFKELLTFKERLTQKPLVFDSNAVVLTEKLAGRLGVSVGDSFTLYEQDDIGNAIGAGYELFVTGVMENYIGNWAYIGGDAYTAATHKSPAYTAFYGHCTEDVTQRATFTDALHEMDAVQTVTYNDETIDSYRKMLRSVDMIVVVLVVSAAALAFIVLYNLTNINITERRREIASLKVLGFTRREVYAYIFREIALLSILGALLGLVLGTYLESFVAVTAEVDYVMFGREIHTSSYGISFVMTLVFSVIAMFFMRHKLNAIDMVESLKSVE